MSNMHGRIPTRNTNSQPEPVSVQGGNVGFTSFTTQLDYVGGTDPIYLGSAAPNSNTASPVWKIRKFTYDINGNVTAVQYAGGTQKFNQIWDNRASLSYS